MFEVVEFGTDFKSDFSFKNGDLVLIEDKDNLVQSVLNRLNTTNGFFDLFYNNYGGVLGSYLGWKADKKTLGFIKVEIINILNQDPRFKKFDVDLKYSSNGSININLNLVYDENSDLSLSFVISDTGVVIIDEEAE